MNYPYTLHTGQELSIPTLEESSPIDQSTVATGTVHVVQSGEHLMQIARELDMDWHQLAEMNGLAAPYLLYPGDVLQLSSDGNENSVDSAETIPPDIPESYTTLQNESLFALAHYFDLSWVRLAAINKLSFPYMLSPGQTLQLK